MHQSFANFDRPKSGYINEFFILSSRSARSRRDLVNNSEQNLKIRRKFAKKNASQNRKIRKNRIKWLLLLFENRRKIQEISPLFGLPRTVSFSFLPHL